MKYSYLFLIVKDIKRKKFSSFLTFFAIALGILSIFIIVILSSSFEDSIKEQFNQLGTNRLYVTTSTSGLSSSVTQGFRENDLEQIESLPYVEKVYPYYFKSAQMKFGRDFSTATLIGTSMEKEFFSDLTLEIDKGRIPSTQEKYSLVVGPRAITETFPRDLQLGSNIYIKDTKFEIVGILKSIGNPQDDSSFYGNINTIRNLYRDEGNVGVMDVKIVEGRDMALAEENLQMFLDREKGEDTTNVVSPTQFLDQLDSILGIVNYTLGGIALVALLVGAFGIINTMYVIVTEKTRAIGIMKAVGARNEDILLLFMTQAGVFGVLGAIFGVALGIPLSWGAGAMASELGYGFLKISISPLLVFGLIGFGFLIGVFSGFLPAYRASKLPIIKSIIR